MVLTREILEEGKSINGNWSEAQLQCFGITRQKNKGWKKQIIGKDFELEAIDKFLRLRNKHLKASQINQQNSWQEILCAGIIYSWFGGSSRT